MVARALVVSPWRLVRRCFPVVVVAAVVAALMSIALGNAPAARADTSPTPGTPDTVSADALPTVQVDGVVWSQVTVGNTVYATGSFSYARPAGTAVGDPSQVARGNLLAYDITTGNLITSFNHTLNGQGQVVTASPDGSTVYVGGDFTVVDGATRQHVAAFDVATGALSPWRVDVPSQVRAIAATNSTVYVGGNFLTANGADRKRLAAFQAGTGALLSWAPTADDNIVLSLLVSPDASSVIVGGKFTTLNGVSRRGIGSVDAATGATATWNPTFPLFDNGNDAGFTSLTTNGTALFGTGYNFGSNGGSGNFEGRFASDFSGNLTWLSSCHGDSYSGFVQGAVFYSASHAHDCSDIGAWENTNPWTWHRALAETVSGAGKPLAPNNNGGYTSFAGLPAGQLLHWYPTLTAGTFTGQGQAAWSVTGNSQYLSWGGEFPKANNVGQQGLVRFAVKTIAPNKAGPFSSAAMTPTVSSPAAGVAKVNWGATWDMDNELLTYRVYRNGGTTPIYSVDTRSNFWSLPTMSFTDTGLAAGSTQTYRVRAFDPYGNPISSPGSTSVTISSTGTVSGAYSDDVRNAGASSYWRLGDASGPLRDAIGGNDLAPSTGVSRPTAGALSTDSNTATTFSGNSDAYASSPVTSQQSRSLTVQAWVRTTSTSGGRLVGMGTAPTGNSPTTDYNLYLDRTGRLLFGVYVNGSPRSVASATTYRDNQWHQVTGTVGSDGLTLYVDGKRVNRDQSVTAASPTLSLSYWRVGGDTLSGWPSAPSSNYPNAAIDEAAVYPSALSLAQIQQQYRDSGRSLPGTTAPSDAYGAAVYASGPDLYYRLDDTSGSSAADASVNQVPGTYSGGSVSYRTASTVTPNGTGATFNGSSSTLASTNPVSNPVVYSTELWMRTTTTRGGKLIGFGSSRTGSSGSYDRHVYMLNSGQLTFGTYTGATNIATTPASYNDGRWHQVVATQSSAGMALYVDGLLVASNPQTAAQAYDGYWRIGGDSIGSWPSAPSSSYFNGVIDEVAVYPTALSAAQVLAHYRASPAAVNRPPTASFTSNCPSKLCTFDGSASSDTDGTIVDWAWDFGDGATGTGAKPDHLYATSGSKNVTLTVTDNSGGKTSIVQTVSPIDTPNQPPQASLTSSCSDLSCSFDSSGSTDADGRITARSWDFGDGTGSTDVAPTHAYAVAGDYPVTLKLTDDAGAQTTKTATVTPTVPANPDTSPFAKDAFNRTTTTGWGTADTGGAWMTSGTTSVTPGSAQWTLAAGGSGNAYLAGAARSDADVTTTLSLDKAATGGGAYAYVVGRRAGANNEYRANLRFYSTGKVGVSITKLAGSSTESAVKAEATVAGLTYTAGTNLNVRFQVTGTSPTTLRAKVWPQGTTEPAAWQVETTDATDGLQVAGAVGMRSYVSGSATNAPLTVKISAFSASPTNTPPVAAFTPSCTANTCTVDATASTDPQGNIASYAWSFGNGATATGPTSSVDYTASGTYRITLTVTDAAGLTSVTRSTVTVP